MPLAMVRIDATTAIDNVLMVFYQLAYTNADTRPTPAKSKDVERCRVLGGDALCLQMGRVVVLSLPSR